MDAYQGDFFFRRFWIPSEVDLFPNFGARKDRPFVAGYWGNGLFLAKAGLTGALALLAFASLGAVSAAAGFAGVLAGLDGTPFLIGLLAAINSNYA